MPQEVHEEVRRRRNYTDSYKLQVLKEAAMARNTGERGAIANVLKIHGLRPSHLQAFQRWQEERNGLKFKTKKMVEQLQSKPEELENDEQDEQSEEIIEEAMEEDEEGIQILDEDPVEMAHALPIPKKRGRPRKALPARTLELEREEEPGPSGHGAGLEDWQAIAESVKKLLGSGWSIRAIDQAKRQENGVLIRLQIEGPALMWL